MNPSHWFSERAQQASERYVMLLSIFDSVFFDKILSGRNALSEAGTQSFTKSLTTLAATHYDSEMGVLASQLRTSSWEARRDALEHLDNPTHPDEAYDPSEALSASEHYASSEFAQQLRRDIEQYAKRHRSLRLQVSIAHRATGKNQNLLLAEFATSERRRKTWFTDRSGRRWPSQKFIRVLWRQTLLETYLVNYIATAAEYGERDIMIWHPDRSHRSFGERVTFEDGGITVGASDVFHPNSDALPRVRRYFEEFA